MRAAAVVLWAVAIVSGVTSLMAGIFAVWTVGEDAARWGATATILLGVALFVGIGAAFVSTEVADR